MATKLKIREGSTFSRTVRWAGEPFVYKEISAISNSAPCRIRAIGHDVLPGQRVAIISAKGLVELNAKESPPNLLTEYYKATVIDADNIELNRVNSTDFKQYTGGGYIQYLTARDMTGHAARLTIKDRIGGTVLLVLTSGPGGGIVIDNILKSIAYTLTAEQTDAFEVSKAVFDLDMISDTGEVYTVLFGAIEFIKE